LWYSKGWVKDGSSTCVLIGAVVRGREGGMGEGRGGGREGGKNRREEEEGGGREGGRRDEGKALHTSHTEREVLFGSPLRST